MVIKPSDHVPRVTLLRRLPIPRNFGVAPESRIERGEVWPAAGGATHTKTFEIYCYGPDSGENPRLDIFGVDLDDCGPMVLARPVTDGSKAYLLIRVKDKTGDNAMYVERLLPAAREKLVTIADDAPLMEVANLLHKGTDLVIVCDSAGLVAGVITKTDVVGQMSRCQGASCTMAASLTMTRDVVICRPGELLQEVWKRMKERKLKNIPVVDKDARPVGVLNARDILQALLEETQDEEAMLRDYVMGIGY